MVTANLPDEATAKEYLAWLEDGHVDQVIESGAHSAMMVRFDPEPQGAKGPIRVLVQYIFPTRQVFQRYIEKHSPALRAEGLKKFGPERGVTFERAIGAIV